VAEVTGAVYEGGMHYGHNLDPHKGWPVLISARSVSVTASSCTEAGLISTMALLHGAGAHALLEEQRVRWRLEALAPDDPREPRARSGVSAGASKIESLA
jgi:thiamine biosynthesis lipoprotein ApbE